MLEIKSRNNKDSASADGCPDIQGERAELPDIAGPNGKQRKPVLVHLTSSSSFGGAERQMLELGKAMRETCRSVYMSFAEEGRCGAFIESVEADGFQAIAINRDFPRLIAAIRELTSRLRVIQPDVICSHGYKANLLGLFAARRLGVPIVAVSHGWTGESKRVRLYEWLDRLALRRMDYVTCVSEAQAKKVIAAGVPENKVQVIHDAVCADRFDCVDDAYRRQLEGMFAEKPLAIVGAAGRLSPEKGFKHFIDAASIVTHQCPDTGFVLFGDGPLRKDLTRQIASRGLNSRFLLAGFRSDLDRYFPHFDLFVLPSYTEGLPNVVLEAYAAGVPVVATAVGGTPELVKPGQNGYLVKPGDADELAERIIALISNPSLCREMGDCGRREIVQRFSFAGQAREYGRLFEKLI